MGTRLSKAVEYASAHEAHEYQVALGLITIPLQLISKSGTKLEHQKDEHVKLTSKMVRSVVVSLYVTVTADLGSRQQLRNAVCYPSCMDGMDNEDESNSTAYGKLLHRISHVPDLHDWKPYKHVVAAIPTRQLFDFKKACRKWKRKRLYLCGSTD
eukprot:gb/GECG01012380.1/.p1 GENE.gb/GECG01012380.1/~~gb/GECG01012380.1/.p1  ORF type:complete len:155 (+),score=17.39 gb/GECG01012380.1/:1-465(+)